MITARFQIGFCSSCQRDVALHTRLAQTEDTLLLACIHCDTHAVERIRALGPQALRGLGYAFDGDPEPQPFEGCGKENCGKGQCKHSSKRHPFKDATPL